jgi:hypothetical protein
MTALFFVVKLKLFSSRAVVFTLVRLCLLVFRSIHIQIRSFLFRQVRSPDPGLHYFVALVEALPVCADGVAHDLEVRFVLVFLRLYRITFGSISGVFLDGCIHSEITRGTALALQILLSLTILLSCT